MLGNDVQQCVQADALRARLNFGVRRPRRQGILDTSFSFCFPYFLFLKFSLRIKYSIGRMEGILTNMKRQERFPIVDSRASAEKVSVYDRTRAGKRYSPASTFKVPHTFFALDAG